MAKTKAQVQNQGQGPRPGPGPGPWKGMERDCLQKCSDDSSVYTAIRYHSHPFDAPSSAPVHKKPRLEKRLEALFERQFYAGRHRLANFFASVSVVLKPLFLCCVLPFYIGFYLLPRCAFDLCAKILKSINPRIDTFLLPMTKTIKGISGFVRTTINRLNLIRQQFSLKKPELKTAKMSLLTMLKTILNPKAWIHFLREPCSALMSRIKIRWLSIENHLRQKGQRLEKLVADVAKAPFIYIGRRIMQLSSRFARLVALPFKRFFSKCSSLIKELKLYFSVKLSSFMNWMKKLRAFVKHGLLDFWTFMRSLRPFSLAADLISQFKFALKRGKVFFNNGLTKKSNHSKPSFSRLSLLFDGPIKKCRHVNETLIGIKSDIKHFAIHLPGKLRNKLLVALPRFFSALSEFQNAQSKKLKSHFTTAINASAQFIPAPVKTGTGILFAIALKCSSKKTLAMSWIATKKHDIVLFFLILRVWIRVILRHAKRLILEY